MGYEPLPTIPDSASAPRGMDPFVRSIILLLITFAFLNIAREATFIIGSIQAYGSPQFRDVGGLGRSFLTAVIVIIFAFALKRGESWARYFVIGLGSVWAIRLGSDLMYMIRLRASGAERTELQIVLFGCMLWTLVATLLLLLSARGRAAFQK